MKTRPKHDDMYILSAVCTFLDDSLDEHGFDYVSEKIIPLGSEELMEIALQNADQAKEAMMEEYRKKYGDTTPSGMPLFAMYLTVWMGAFSIGYNVTRQITPEQAFSKIDLDKNLDDYTPDERMAALKAAISGVDIESLRHTAEQRVKRAEEAATEIMADRVLMAGIFIDGMAVGSMFPAVHDNLVGSPDFDQLKEWVDGIELTEALLKSFK